MGNAIYYEQCREQGMPPEVFESNTYQRMSEKRKNNLNLEYFAAKHQIETITFINNQEIGGDHIDPDQSQVVVKWENLGKTSKSVSRAYLCGFRDAVSGNEEQSSWFLLPKTWQRGYDDAKNEKYYQAMQNGKTR